MNMRTKNILIGSALTLSTSAAFLASYQIGKRVGRGHTAMQILNEYLIQNNKIQQRYANHIDSISMATFNQMDSLNHIENAPQSEYKILQQKYETERTKAYINKLTEQSILLDATQKALAQCRQH